MEMPKITKDVSEMIAAAVRCAQGGANDEAEVLRAALRDAGFSKAARRIREIQDAHES